MHKESKNRRLEHQLARLEAQAHAAKTPAHISVIADEIKKFASAHTYRFNNTLPIIGIGMALLSGLLCLLGNITISDDQRFYWLLASLGVAMSCLAVIIRRHRRVSAVSELIYGRAVALKANIERDYNYRPKQYYKELKRTFLLFNKGDEGHSITKRYTGETSGLTFTLVEFKYIESSGRNSSSGAGTSHRQRTVRYRYALLFSLNKLNYLSINVKRFSNKWDSSNSRFNKLFKVHSGNDIAVAKFFDPKTVLAFVDKFSFIKSLDATTAGEVCIEVPKEVFPSKVKSASLRNHPTFAQQLINPASIVLLEKSKELMQLIHKQQ